MKLLVLIILTFLLSFQEAGAKDNSKSVCYLKDRFFIQQVNDINLNPQDYKDKIIQIEGLFNKYVDENNVERYVVYRKTAGCCGDDGSSGFEFAYKKEKLNFKPEQWILVEARVAERTAKGGNHVIIYLEATSVVEKPKGKEFVM
jgi:uncharacterized membrane protein YcgQ (UPF0703/DUF1980 family)